MKVLRYISLRRDDLLLLFPAAIAGLIYFLTMAPGVVGFDSAELITGAHTLGIVHPTGYPLYLLIAKLFTLIPIKSVAFRVNLVSVVFGILAVYLTARWIFASTKSMLSGWAGALALGISYGMWSMATVAEVYTLQVTLILVLLIAMRVWLKTEKVSWLYLMAFVFGLCMTNHVTSALFLPSLIYIVVTKLGIKTTVKRSPFLVAFGVLGLLFYLYLPIRYVVDPPLNYVKSYYQIDLTTIEGMWWMVTGRAYRFFAFGYDLASYGRELVDAFILLSKNFTPLGVILGLIGVISILKQKTHEGVAMLLAFTLNMAFFAGYAVSDKDTMFLSAFGVWALFIGFGVHSVIGWIKSLRLPHRERYSLRSAFSGALIVSQLLIAGFNLQWLDRSSNYGPDLYARRVLSTLPENAFVIGRWSSAVILEYYQHVEGLRPDIHIFNRSRYEVALYYELWDEGVGHEEAMAQILAIEEGIIDAFSEDRAVFDAEYNPYLAQYYEYQPVGQVFQLIPRQEG